MRHAFHLRIGLGTVNRQWSDFGNLAGAQWVNGARKRVARNSEECVWVGNEYQLLESTSPNSWSLADQVVAFSRSSIIYAFHSRFAWSISAALLRLKSERSQMGLVLSIRYQINPRWHLRFEVSPRTYCSDVT